MQTQFVTDSGLAHGTFLFPVDKQMCWGHRGFWGGAAQYSPDSRVSVALATHLSLFDEAKKANLALNSTTIAERLIELASK